MIWIQFWVRLLGRSKLSNPSDLPCYFCSSSCWTWTRKHDRKYGANSARTTTSAPTTALSNRKATTTALWTRSTTALCTRSSTALRSRPTTALCTRPSPALCTRPAPALCARLSTALPTRPATGLSASSAHGAPDGSDAQLWTVPPYGCPFSTPSINAAISRGMQS